MLKVRKVPKLVKCLCVLLLLTLLVPLAIPASANNSDDHLHLRERSGVALSSSDTYTRPKEDSTSAYAYNDASNVTINSIKVMGLSTPSDTCWQGTDLTYGSPVRLPVGSASYLPNLVYEYGYHNAGLVFNFQYADVYLHIWSSPDSV